MSALFNTDLGVSLKTVARYKASPDKLPTMAARLLKLRHGDLAGLLDSSWQGFTFRQGELFHPFYKYGFTADEVKGWFFGRQELEARRREVKSLNQEVETLRAQAWAADKLRGLVSGIPCRDARSKKQGW